MNPQHVLDFLKATEADTVSFDLADDAIVMRPVGVKRYIYAYVLWLAA